MTQKTANDNTLATRTRTVCSRWCRCQLWPRLRAKEAPMMEKAMPAAASAQKGTTSFSRCERPCLPQAHLRLSQ